MDAYTYAIIKAERRLAGLKPLTPAQQAEQDKKTKEHTKTVAVMSGLGAAAGMKLIDAAASQAADAAVKRAKPHVLKLLKRGKP